MKRIIPEAIEKYAAEHSAPESALLKELVKETYAKTEIPQMQVGHLEGDFLRLLARIVRAKSILEIGTFTGYSALVMAEALPPDGKIITLDLDESCTAIAKKYWAKSPHGKKIELRLGSAIEAFPKLKGPFDLVFMDADKENYVRYWEEILPKVRKGGLIVVDNVLWSGRALDPIDATDHAIANFNEHAKNDKRVEVVMLTVRDGITLAFKK